MNQHNHNSNGPDGAGAAPEAAAALAQPLVYVKGVIASEMPGLNGVPPDTIVYAIHSAEGAPLAVVGTRAAAFSVARQNNMHPVSVH